ncbi:hypothetical protein J6590_033749, partial [Homalodisca vitripennis]
EHALLMPQIDVQAGYDIAEEFSSQFLYTIALYPPWCGTDHILPTAFLRYHSPLLPQHPINNTHLGVPIVGHFRTLL